MPRICKNCNERVNDDHNDCVVIIKKEVIYKRIKLGMICLSILLLFKK